jgi:hypothetical protein
VNSKPALALTVAVNVDAKGRCLRQNVLRKHVMSKGELASVSLHACSRLVENRTALLRYRSAKRNGAAFAVAPQTNRTFRTS